MGKECKEASTITIIHINVKRIFSTSRDIRKNIILHYYIILRPRATYAGEILLYNRYNENQSRVQIMNLLWVWYFIFNTSFFYSTGGWIWMKIVFHINIEYGANFNPGRKKINWDIWIPSASNLTTGANIVNRNIQTFKKGKNLLSKLVKYGSDQIPACNKGERHLVASRKSNILTFWGLNRSFTLWFFEIFMRAYGNFSPSSWISWRTKKYFNRFRDFSTRKSNDWPFNKYHQFYFSHRWQGGTLLI